MSSNDRNTILWCLAILAITALGLVVGRELRPAHSSQTAVGIRAGGGSNAPTPVAGSLGGSQVQGLPAPGRTELAVGGESPPQPSVIVEVINPSKLRGALSNNAWIQSELKQPLGRGFVGSWAGFLGTRGEDIKAAFTGPVIDFLSDKLLSSPFRAVWFTGDQAPGTPALVMDHPTDAARDGFKVIAAVARRGTVVASACPGIAHSGTSLPRKEAAGSPSGSDGGSGSEIEIQRWVLADQPLYAAESLTSLVLGRTPLAVLDGVCAALPLPAPIAHADLAVSVTPEGLGHEGHLLMSLLGLGGSPQISATIEGDTLIPLGLSGSLDVDGRLGTATPSPDLLRLVPVDAPVVMTLELRLPLKLDPASLRSFLSSRKADPEAVTREVTLVWEPRGDHGLTSEVALVWSRTADAPEMREAFSGPNHLETAEICGHLVLTGSADLLRRMKRACEGQAPALANAGQPVVAGLTAPQSIGLAVQVGRVLSRLTVDGWTSDGHGATKDAPAQPVPPEIQQAQEQLEGLPVLGFTGTAQAGQLVPGGFHS